jgi:hypothetical protein
VEADINASAGHHVKGLCHAAQYSGSFAQ